MALDQSALLDLLGQLKLTDVTDRVRSATEKLYQELTDAEATAFIGAGLFVPAHERTMRRDGIRPLILATTAGELELKIPKLRQGSFFPSLLERRRRVDQALFAVVWRRTCTGSQPGKSGIWSRLSGLIPGIIEPS
jgi:putative transposase